MSADVLTRAKAALEGVTEGPWTYDLGSWEGGGRVLSSETYNGYPMNLFDSGDPFQEPCTGRADARFIAESRTLVPELMALAESQAAKLAAIRELHKQAPVGYGIHCKYCTGPWPCPIVAIIDGTQS